MEMLLLGGKEQVSLFNPEHEVSWRNKKDWETKAQQRLDDKSLIGRMGKTKLLLCNKLVAAPAL